MTGPPAARPPRLQFDNTFGDYAFDSTTEIGIQSSASSMRDGEVMLAYQTNGEQSPLLNGLTRHLIVPGWYSTYWLKMLNGVEVFNPPDDNY